MLRYLVVVIAVSAGSSLGWLLGSRFGFFTGYLLAVVGASIGLYCGRKYARHHL